MTINYKTAGAEEITSFIEKAIKTIAKDLADSPKSRSMMVNNTIGFFQGVMMARGFDYDIFETVLKWADLA